jgi:hypothetical protein
MPFDFPDNPFIGQIFKFYTWDGEKWVLTVGGTMAPPPPTPGDGYAITISPLRAGLGSSVIAEFNVGKTTLI